MNTRSQRIPLKSISALTLHAGRKTTSRRVPAVPQLQCRGKACKTFQPPVVQCVPVGSDGVGGLEWKCEADLPSNIGLGEVEVSCEGWDGPDDPYVLKGSCGLTYNLVKTPGALYESPYLSPSSSSRSQIQLSDILTILLVLYVIYAFIGPTIMRFFRSFFPPSGPNARRPPWSGWNPFSGWGGGGGGGNGGGGGGGRGPPPPPPYTKYANEDTQAWRPGFFSGLAAGAAATQGMNYLRSGYRPGYTRDDLYYDRGVGPSRDRGRGGDGGSSSGAGTSMRTSSGFGGTRNR